MRVKLQKLRAASGYTQQQLSAITGISRNHIAQIETGDKNPSFPVALKIKRALNYYGDDLFDNATPGASRK